MKNINQILSHIALDPNFNKVNTFLDIKRFVNILPLKLKSGIKFVYVKNETMHFVLTHQLYKVEFEHNKATLKVLLKMVNFENITNFSFFVSNVVEKKSKILNKIAQNIKKKVMQSLKIGQRVKIFIKNLKR